MSEAYVYVALVFLFLCWIVRQLLRQGIGQQSRLAYMTALAGLLALLFFMLALLVPPLWTISFPLPLVAFGCSLIACLIALRFARER